MALTVTHRSADPATLGTPLLIVPVAKGATLPPLDALDTALGGAIGRCRAAGDFTGAKDEVAVLYPSTGKAERIMLVGLGDVEKVTASSLRRAAMIAGKRARVLGAPSAVLLFVPSTAPAVDAAKAGQSLAEGLPFGAWHYPDLKRPPETPKPKFESMTITERSPLASRISTLPTRPPAPPMRTSAISAAIFSSRGRSVICQLRTSPSRSMV